VVCLVYFLLKSNLVFTGFYLQSSERGLSSLTDLTKKVFVLDRFRVTGLEIAMSFSFANDETAGCNFVYCSYGDLFSEQASSLDLFQSFSKTFPAAPSCNLQSCSTLKVLTKLVVKT